MVSGENPPVASEEHDGGQMVPGELEAAEALAGLARRALTSGDWSTVETVVSATHSQDQPAMNPVKIVDNNPSQMCSTSYQPNPVIKTRRKLTQAEKEERKVRRILANRESARQTIRRRQLLEVRELVVKISVKRTKIQRAVHVELTKKAADVLEENERLKKEKELTLEEYNSLKHTYAFLKAQLDKIKKAAVGEPEAEKPGPSSTSTSNQVFLHNQTSIIPCFWPPIFPSSDAFPFQYSSHSQNTSLSQFPIPNRDSPSSHQGQEYSTRPGAPPSLLLYPVPWLLPFLSPGTNDRTNTCSRCSCPESRPHEDTNQSPSPQNIHSGGQQDAGYPPGHIIVPGLFSPVRPMENISPMRPLENIGPPWGGPVDDNVNVVSTPEDRGHGLLQRNQEPKPEDAFATTMARRRRKELMKLKNVHLKSLG